MKRYEPDGDLTIFEAASFKERLAELLFGEGAVTLDLSKAGQVDCSALQLIVAASRSDRLSLIGASRDIGQKLERLGWCSGSARS